ncbi:hypothetical protein NOVO_02205 [Rickettsiales bacterium Ac37b]|nr:hypothetical protein NOVO_02205 [Rickettsiales bacterium Ac37b]
MPKNIVKSKYKNLPSVHTKVESQKGSSNSDVEQDTITTQPTSNNSLENSTNNQAFYQNHNNQPQSSCLSFCFNQPQQVMEVELQAMGASSNLLSENH